MSEAHSLVKSSPSRTSTKSGLAMSYTPNFRDPRIQRRLSQALDFVKKYVREDQAHWLSTREIDRHLGSQKRDLGKYLRGKLLICENKYYNKDTGTCKTYRRNEQGYQELKDIDNTYTQSMHYSVAVLSNELEQQLISGQFEYNDTSSRLYNPIQNLRRAEKKPLLADHGYRFQYDIQCAAATLIHQYAQKQGLDLYLHFLRDYIKNRRRIRQEIADSCEISVDSVKKIINGLLQGARLIDNHYHPSSIYRELQGDSARILFLQQHPYIQGFREDIRECWRVIEPSLPSRTITTRTGQVRRLPLSGRTKTALYRDIERSVLDVVRRYLELTDNQYFLEHDGWSSKNEIDLDELRDYVRLYSGYDIEVDHEVVG